jgi:hypothetical protein
MIKRSGRQGRGDRSGDRSSSTKAPSGELPHTEEARAVSHRRKGSAAALE